MKKLLFFLLLIPFIGSSQIKQPVPGYGFSWNRGEFNVGLRLPRVTTGTANTNGGAQAGDAYYNTVDSTVYVYTGTQWLPLGAGGGEVTNEHMVDNDHRINFNLAESFNFTHRSENKQVWTFLDPNDQMHELEYENNRVWGLSINDPAKLFRFNNVDDISDFDTLNLGEGDTEFYSAFDVDFVPWKNRVYTGAGENDDEGYSYIYEIDPDSDPLDKTIIFTRFSNPYFYPSAFAHNDTSLFVLFGDGMLYKINLTTYVADSLQLTGASNAHGLEFDGDDLYGSDVNNSRVWKVAPGPLTETLTADIGANGITDDFDFAGDNIWFGVENSAGLLRITAKSDLSTTTLATGVLASCYAVKYYKDYIWALFNTSPATIVRVDPRTREIYKFNLATGENVANEMTGDAQRMFFSTFATPRKLIRIAPSQALTYVSGGSGVQSVLGTINRITSTGGLNPVIDISSTFEALLWHVSDTASKTWDWGDITGEPAFVTTNIYNSNGSLTGTRTVSLSSNLLTIQQDANNKIQVGPGGFNAFYNNGTKTSDANITPGNVIVQVFDTDELGPAVYIELTDSVEITGSHTTSGHESKIVAVDTYLRFLQDAGNYYFPNMVEDVGTKDVRINLSTGKLTYHDIVSSYTTEQVQDDVGAMINASLQYVDGTPLLAINDRDFGDITTTGSGLTMTIDDASVEINDINATGTPNSGTFLRGDGTWVAASVTSAPWNGLYAITSEISSTSMTMVNTTTWSAFTGSGDGVWTLPALSSNLARALFVKNATAFNLTIQRAGSDQIYDNGAVTSVVIGPGESRQFTGQTTYWYSNSDGLPSGSGMAIGDPVTGGTPGRILYVDGSGDLIDDNGLVYDDGIDQLQLAASLSVGTFGKFGSYIEFSEIATPATPGSGLGRIYQKADGFFYGIDDAGTETRLSNGAGGGNVSNTGTPVNNQIAIWTDATTIEGTADFTNDGTTFISNDFTKLTGGVSTTSYQTITSGSSGTVSNTITTVRFDPGSVLASYTLTMPASPVDGQWVDIYFGGTVGAGAGVVTALTISPNTGHTIYQPITPTQGNGGDHIAYQFISSTSQWIRKK